MTYHGDERDALRSRLFVRDVIRHLHLNIALHGKVVSKGSVCFLEDVSAVLASSVLQQYARRRLLCLQIFREPYSLPSIGCARDAITLLEVLGHAWTYLDHHSRVVASNMTPCATLLVGHVNMGMVRRVDCESCAFNDNVVVPRQCRIRQIHELGPARGDCHQSSVGCHGAMIRWVELIYDR
jgi:hypothetical protein